MFLGLPTCKILAEAGWGRRGPGQGLVLGWSSRNIPSKEKAKLGSSPERTWSGLWGGPGGRGLSLGGEGANRELKAIEPPGNGPGSQGQRTEYQVSGGEQRRALRVGQTAVGTGVCCKMGSLWESCPRRPGQKRDPVSQDHRLLRAEPKVHTKSTGERFGRVCRWGVQSVPAAQGALPILPGTHSWASASESKFLGGILASCPAPVAGYMMELGQHTRANRNWVDVMRIEFLCHSPIQNAFIQKASAHACSVLALADAEVHLRC